jgi:chloramphenicol 3-O phosphotransferase
MKPGRVVVLNGTSSAGKTSIACRFRTSEANAGRCWLLIGIDDFNDKLPFPWMRAGDHDGAYSDDGVQFVPTTHGIVVRTGPVGRRWYAAYRRTVAACARAGIDVIVDDVVYDEAAARDWRDALDGLDVTWVAVHCDVDVAEARERARGDRLHGVARGMAGAVHAHVRYDIELDATSASPDDLAAELADALRSVE